MLKKILKKYLGDKYKYLRFKKILEILFNKKFKYLYTKKKILKIYLVKKISNQKIITKERGFVLNFIKDNFFSYHLRPKLSNNFKLESNCLVKENFAIIIQGPIKDLYIFLLETLNIYKKIFTNSIFIISTWDDEDVNKIKNLEDEKTFVIFNNIPNPSPFNIDHQTKSTFEALKFAKTKNVKYCIKTRADTRIYKNNLESLVVSLISLFPLDTNISKIKSRIILPSLGTFKYRLFGISDIVMIGDTDDLMIYFDSEPYYQGIKKYFNKDDIKFCKNVPYANHTPIVAEVFLCSRFIFKMENQIKWNLDFNWKIIRDYFCIIDNSMMDIFWYKYEWQYEYRHVRTYADTISRGLDFSEWLSLYKNHHQINWKKISSEHEKYDENQNLLNFRN